MNTRTRMTLGWTNTQNARAFPAVRGMRQQNTSRPIQCRLRARNGHRRYLHPHPLTTCAPSVHCCMWIGTCELPEDATDGDESDDGDWPVTPENVPEPEPNTQQDGDAGLESEDNELPMSGSSTKHSLPTLWKPSPFAFAARRWGSHEGGRQYEQDRDHSQFFRAYSRTDQTFSMPKRGPAASWGTGTATNVSTGLGDASRAPGTGACGGDAGGAITRVEWMQVNGTAPEFRKWDTYEVDSVSSSEEVC